MGRRGVASVSILLAGCAANPMQGPNPGPTLVVEVRNRSNDDVVIGYAFEGFMTSGSGEFVATACRREALRFAPIAGDYEILVDGERVTSGRAATLPGEFLVYMLEIHENGSPVIVGFGTRRQAPETNVEIASCGET